MKNSLLASSISSTSGGRRGSWSGNFFALGDTLLHIAGGVGEDGVAAVPLELTVRTTPCGCDLVGDCIVATAACDRGCVGDCTGAKNEVSTDHFHLSANQPNLLNTEYSKPIFTVAFHLAQQECEVDSKNFNLTEKGLIQFHHHKSGKTLDNNGIEFN